MKPVTCGSVSGRAVELGQHPVGGGVQVGRAVDQRAVEVEDERGHAARPACAAACADGADVGAVGVRVGDRAAAEDGRAGDEHVGAGGDDLRRGLGRHAAVDLQVDRAVADQLAHARDLGQHGGDEALAAEAGVHRHDADEVDAVEHPGDGLGRGRGVERDAGPGAEVANRLQRAVEMRAGLGVDGQDVGAGLGKGGQVGIDRGDHQVDVERRPDMRPDGFDQRRAEGDVRHEMPVHDVDMHPVGALVLDGAALGAEGGKVGGQDRGRDLHGAVEGHWRAPSVSATLSGILAGIARGWPVSGSGCGGIAPWAPGRPPVGPRGRVRGRVRPAGAGAGPAARPRQAPQVQVPERAWRGAAMAAIARECRGFSGGRRAIFRRLAPRDGVSAGAGAGLWL